MGHEAISWPDLGSGNRKYLFFPGALYVADNESEGHIGILTASGRTVDMIQIAGGYTVDENDQVIVVDARGSLTLRIPPGISEPVVQHIKLFPGSENKEIIGL